MRRRKKNEFKSKPTERKPKSEKVERIEYLKNPALNLVQEEFQKIFWPEEHAFKWRGLCIEHPHQKSGYGEEMHYLQEIENKQLYEDEIRKMLSKLKNDGRIIWWEVIKEDTKWGEKKLTLRCK